MRLELYEEKPEAASAALVQVFEAFSKETEEAELQTVRYNLVEDADVFAQHPVVNQAMQKMEAPLPLMLVDGEIMTLGAYPDMEDLTEITGLSFQDIRTGECQCGNCNCRKG
ncbi:arsenic metallochaperone ArsD family protein [Lactococcus garvieae]|uniref:arsenic metallochaperone ArsD family protein n=1 Tax=Lactococcus garvieae TaxID=1363 RepID=UPI003854B213